MCSKLFLLLPPALKNAQAIGVTEKDIPYTEYLHSKTLANLSKADIVILVL